MRRPPHHGVASIIWRKRWKRLVRQDETAPPHPTAETSWTLTCPGDWPHPSQYWWDSRVPAGYWWWGCGASSYRNQRCPESASLRYLHGNSTGRRFKKGRVLMSHMQAVANRWHENSPVSQGYRRKRPKSRWELQVDGSRSRGGLDSNRSFFVWLSWRTGDDVPLPHNRISSFHCNSAKRFGE